ncbi:MAG: hypothetical protein U0165_13965 [Polyangiaceae bacterium]
MKTWQRSGALILSVTILIAAMIQASGLGCSNAPESNTPASSPAGQSPPNSNARGAATESPTPATNPTSRPDSPSGKPAIPDLGLPMGASKAPVFYRPPAQTSASSPAQAPNPPPH